MWTTMRRFGPSAAVFLGGIGAFYVADLLIASFTSDATVAEWALLRAYMNGMGTLALFGLHGLLLREPGAAGLIVKIALLQICATAVLGGVLATYLGWAPSFVTAIVPVLGFAANAMLFQWLRSRRRLNAAYIVSGSWRVAFLAGVVGLVLTGLQSPPIVLCLAFLASAAVSLAVPRLIDGGQDSASGHGDVTSVRDVYRVGGSLLLAHLSLAVSAYGEVIVINHLGTGTDVATYFRAALFYLLPGVVVSQYVGAQIEPLLRDSESAAQGYIRKYLWPALTGLVLVVYPGLLLGGWVLERILTGQNETPLLLALILSLTTCVRLAYILPSSYVGILADRLQLTRAALTYFVFAMLMPVAALALTFAGLNPVIAVAIANLINWAARTLVGIAVIRGRMQTGVPPSCKT